jgi:hypothetical protein
MGIEIRISDLGHPLPKVHLFGDHSSGALWQAGALPKPPITGTLLFAFDEALQMSVLAV